MIMTGGLSAWLAVSSGIGRTSQPARSVTTRQLRNLGFLTHARGGGHRRHSTDWAIWCGSISYINVMQGQYTVLMGALAMIWNLYGRFRKVICDGASAGKEAHRIIYGRVAVYWKRNVQQAFTTCQICFFCGVYLGCNCSGWTRCPVESWSYHHRISLGVMQAEYQNLGLRVKECLKQSHVTRQIIWYNDKTKNYVSMRGGHSGWSLYTT